jgi:two-component system, LytTR family, response regulator LytT
MNILLLDDEYLALNLLEGYVQQLIEQGRDITLVGKAKHPLKALEILEQQHVDILFLDIQMPNLSGVNLLKTLQLKPVVVFTTAYSEYALEAFNLDVVDYLVKPIAFERFLQALNKATSAVKAKAQTIPSRLIQSTFDASSPLAFPLPHQAPKSTALSVTADGKLVKIPFSDILYCEGAKEYVILHTTQGKIMTLERMKRIEELLPSEDFVRVHKSYIVSVARAVSLEGAMLNVGGQMIPVSRDLRDAVIARIFV